MNSDDEDFNDIYGDDEGVTKNDTQEPSTEESTAKEQPDSNANEVSNATATAASDLQHDGQEGSGETDRQAGSSNSGAGSDVSAEAGQNTAANSNPVSQLDQLAALQALSSNLNQLQADKSSGTGGNEPDSSGQGNSGSVSTNPTWEQLQQTMSQFQQQGQQQSQSQQDQQPVGSTEGTPDNAQVAPRPHIKADISKDNCKMFIGGLNWETTEDGLREYFSKYGRVVDLRIMKDNNTGRSRGFGFLTFESPSSVDEVVKTQHILDGKVIDPKRSIPREEKDKTGKIFVGGIGADVRPKEFEEFFAKYGTIIDAQLMLDKDTGRSRGFGFVTYDSPDAVDRVCQNKYIEFKGKQIEIKRAEPRHMQKGHGSGGGHGNNYNNYNNNNRNNNNNNNSNSNSNFGSASPMAMQNPYGAAMYQNPMMNMGGFNPMFNPQAMQEYYQKMQEYYQQMQQQTGMDPAQMYQQQMQQMAMMMSGGYGMPGMMQSPSPGMMQAGMHSHDNSLENSRGAGGRNNSNNNNGSTDGANSGDNGNDDDEDGRRVQTIGGESADDRPSGDHSGNSGKSSSSNSIDINLPRGPRDPNTIPPPSGHGGGYSGQRDRDRDRGHQGGYRGGNSGGSGSNSYRGGGYRNRGGFRRSNNSSSGGGYHPYKR